MDLKPEEVSARRFATYVERLASEIGHADRINPLRDYCPGLMLPGERKSVEPMAARTALARTAAQHQSLLPFVGVSSWSDEKVLAKVREMVLPVMEKAGRSRLGSSILLVLTVGSGVRRANARSVADCRRPLTIC